MIVMLIALPLDDVVRSCRSAPQRVAG